MKKRFLLALAALTLGCSIGAAQELDQNPIDVHYAACLARDTSTENIYVCAFEAYASWDKVLDQQLKRLLRNLKSDKDRASVKHSQDVWMSFRDNEFKTYDIAFNRPGKTWVKMRANCRVDLVKARALQLKSYNEVLEKRK